MLPRHVEPGTSHHPAFTSPDVTLMPSRHCAVPGEKQLALDGSLVPDGTWLCGPPPPDVGTHQLSQAAPGCRAVSVPLPAAQGSAVTRAPLSPDGNLTIYRDMIGHVQCFRHSKRDVPKALDSAEMNVIA